MTDTRVAPGTAGPAGHLDSAYVDWASIIGGSIVAAAIFTTLTIFGSAVGLSFTTASLGSGVSGKAAAIAVGLWSAWVAISSFAAGGFIAGRLRHRIADASVTEVEMRDGLHGLISWALAGLFSGLILTAAASGIGGQGRLGQAASTVQAYEVNRMFRGERAADEGAHADASSVLASAVANKDLPGDDKGYLMQLVASKTGLAPAAVGPRIDQAMVAIQTSIEQTRRGSVFAAFLAAMSLALGAAAAWWAGTVGGTHRDEGHPLSPFTRWN